MHSAKLPRRLKKPTKSQRKPINKPTKRTISTRPIRSISPSARPHLARPTTTQPKSTTLIPRFITFSTTVHTPEVFHEDEDLNDGETRVPFSIKDAIKIKGAIIDALKSDTSVRQSLTNIGAGAFDSMLKQTEIDNLVGFVTLHVIQHLARNGDISLPDIGAGTVAAQNFNTLYSVLQFQDGSGKLKQLSDEQWCAVMELTFGTDPVITQNVSISDKAAIKIASEYRSRVQSKAFYQEVQEKLMQYPIDPSATPKQLELTMKLRQMELSQILSPILEGIYSQYQFDGAEGFCLMKKAMEVHSSHGEIVEILNDAQRAITEASGLDPFDILEN